ncbi:MAG: hypothetical protein Q8K60_06475, partial [Parachlamydiaceae bacterium]|nr:hypothetical protein [Parachlamydiaceae bacterium]
MINQWIKWVNVLIIMIAFGICIATGIYWLKKPSHIETSFPTSKELGLPKTAFELPIEAYDEISGPLLSLESQPPALQVPDIKGQLLFYGKNGRPDAQKNYTILHFALTSNNKNIASIKPNEPLYLVFDRSTTPGKYIFSPNNEKTSLWIQAT